MCPPGPPTSYAYDDARRSSQIAVRSLTSLEIENSNSGATPFPLIFSSYLHPCQKEVKARKWKKTSTVSHSTIAFNLFGNV